MSLSIATPTPHRARRVAVILLALVVALASCRGSSSTPDVAADRAVVADAVARTQEVATGRFVVDIHMGAAEGVGARVLRTTVAGAFDRSRGAYDATVDLEAVLGSLPEVGAGLPPELLGDTLQVRVIGRDAWGRNRTDGPWRTVLGGAADLPTLTGSAGPDELLALVAASGGEVRHLGGGRFEGTISADEVRSTDDGGPDRFAVLAARFPAELGERLLRYEAVVDDHGLVDELLVELDVESMAAAAGEPAPDGVVFRYTVHFSDLGRPVEIEPPA